MENIYAFKNNKNVYILIVSFLLVFRCPTLQPNLNFIDCIPYPGLSCSFKCKDGYQLAANDTVFCDSFGKWSSQTSTLCEGLFIR